MRYCGEDDVDALNLIEIIFKQPSPEGRTQGYFNIREKLPEEERDKYDERMRILTSRLNMCSIK